MVRVAVGSGAELEVLLTEERPHDAGRWTALYLHGFGSCQIGEKAAFFRERLAAEGISFCSFDFRGHGGSGGALGELTFSRTLEDVARVRAWLAERGHRRLVLLGSSMGGATALAAAARDPGGIAACLLIAPAVGMATALERWAGAERLAAWRREGRLRYESERVDAELSWELLADLRCHDFSAVARDLTVPALVVQGGRDASVDFRDVLAFVAATPTGLVDLVLWADGDHRLLDRKHEIWEKMRSFLVARGLLRTRHGHAPAARSGGTMATVAGEGSVER